MGIKLDLLIAQFPGQYQTQPCAADWVADTYHKAKSDSRFGRVTKTRLVGTPITALRNRVCRTAMQEGYSHILMVDSDMHPDMNGHGYPSDQPFFETAFDFIYQKHLHAPCIIAAPYVGPPPYENVYCFLWRNRESGHPNIDWFLEGYSREEAAKLGGIQRCAAIPTGVCIIDVRGLYHCPKPWFYYGYKDEYEADVVMTEDVAFSRNWGMTPAPQYGLEFMPVYTAWSCWASHLKFKMCGKPIPLTEDDVSGAYLKAAKCGFKQNERMIMLGSTPHDKPPVYKGDTLVYDYSDRPNDPRVVSNVVPACSRGEFDQSDKVTRDSVMLAPANNTVVFEKAPEHTDFTFRVPRYETEDDLGCGREIPAERVQTIEDYTQPVTFPSDPFASPTACPSFAPPAYVSELRDAFPALKDRSAVCPGVDDLPKGFCMKERVPE